MQVLDEALRTDFGFKHMLWVYSGRRGIHCWVSDRSACSLPDDARKAIVGWLEVIRGSGNQQKKVNLGASFKGRSLHPALQRALDGPLKKAFSETVLQDQDPFRKVPGWERLIGLLPPGETDALTKLKNTWESGKRLSSMDKWEDVMALAAKNPDVWKPYCEEIILQYTYPRIDAEVSKHQNHLLKSPFVVHPSTGRVCVPLPVSEVADFDPENDCPTVAQILREHDKFSRDVRREQGAAVDPNVNAWDHTSLKHFVDHFDKHCQGIVRETDNLRRGEQLTWS